MTKEINAPPAVSRKPGTEGKKHTHKSKPRSYKPHPSHLPLREPLSPPWFPTQPSPGASGTYVLHRKRLHTMFSASFLFHDNEPTVKSESPEAGTLTPSDCCFSDEEPSPGALAPCCLLVCHHSFPTCLRLREQSPVSNPSLMRSCVLCKSSGPLSGN